MFYVRLETLSVQARALKLIYVRELTRWRAWTAIGSRPIIAALICAATGAAAPGAAAPSADAASVTAEAPTHLTVPSGSRVPLDYDQPVPVLAVRLQEMFGAAETPRPALHANRGDRDGCAG